MNAALYSIPLPFVFKKGKTIPNYIPYQNISLVPLDINPWKGISLYTFISEIGPMVVLFHSTTLPKVSQCISSATLKTKDLLGYMGAILSF